MLESISTPLQTLSFEEAVRLFKEWGFQVEPGPRPEEVTLIIEGPDYRTYSVHPVSELAQMAAVTLRVRQDNWLWSGQLRQKAEPGRGQPIIFMPIGVSEMLS